MNSKSNIELNDIIKATVEALHSKNMLPLEIKKCTVSKTDLWADVSENLLSSYDKIFCNKMVKWWERNTNSIREKIEEAFSNRNSECDKWVGLSKNKLTKQIRGDLRKDVGSSKFEKGIETQEMDLF